VSWGSALVGWIGGQLPALTTALEGFAKAGWDWIVKNAPGWVSTLAQWGSALLGWIGDRVKGLPDELKKFAQAGWDWITKNAPTWVSTLKAWGATLLDWVGEQVTKLPGELKKLAQAGWEWVTTNAPGWVSAVESWAKAFVDWVGPLLKQLPGKLGEIKDAAIKWVGDNKDAILTKLGEWKDAFLEWVTPLVKALPAKLGEIKDSIVTWITDTAIPAIKKAWEGLEPAIVPTIVGALEHARDGMKPVWADITGYFVDFEPTGKRLERLFDTIGKTWKDVVQPAAEGVAKALGTLFGELTKHTGEGKAKGPWQMLADAVNATSAAWEKWIDDAGTVVDWLRKVADALRPIVDMMSGKTLADMLMGQPPDWLKGLIGGGSSSGGGGASSGGGGSGGLPTLPAGFSFYNMAGAFIDAVLGAGSSAHWAFRAGTNTVDKWRDMGGWGNAGQPYLIGRGPDLPPEYFVPSSSGMFGFRGGRGGGDVHVTVKIGDETFARMVAKANSKNSQRGISNARSPWSPTANRL
jgi:hypothetical protein